MTRARAFWMILKYTWNRTWVKYTWNATPFWKIKLKFTSNFKYTSNYSVPFWIRNVLETWNLRLGTWREKQLSPAFTKNTLSRKQSNLSSRLKKKITFILRFVIKNLNQMSKNIRGYYKRWGIEKNSQFDKLYFFTIWREISWIYPFTEYSFKVRMTITKCVYIVYIHIYALIYFIRTI